MVPPPGRPLLPASSASKTPVQTAGRLPALRPHDSPLEGDGFEPSVPLARVSLDSRGGEGASGRSDRLERRRPFHGGPVVRIRLPPPASPSHGCLSLLQAQMPLLISYYFMQMAERVYEDAAATERERCAATLARWGSPPRSPSRTGRSQGTRRPPRNPRRCRAAAVRPTRMDHDCSAARNDRLYDPPGRDHAWGYAVR